MCVWAVDVAQYPHVSIMDNNTSRHGPAAQHTNAKQESLRGAFRRVRGGYVPTVTKVPSMVGEVEVRALSGACMRVFTTSKGVNSRDVITDPNDAEIILRVSPGASEGRGCM